MAEIAELIERLEKATGPDHGLDREIESYFWDSPHPQWKSDAGLPRYTSSIDAALTLVPEGWRTASVEERFVGGEWLWSLKSCGVYAWGVHRCTAIALCIAALKARAALVQSLRDTYVDTNRKKFGLPARSNSQSSKETRDGE